MVTTKNNDFMQKALSLAASRKGYCAPNPAVGAVIVKAGKVIAKGRHYAAGYAHAEVDALQSIDKAAAMGATLYVTLEPCSHHGRTPPCVDAIIQQGISKVYYGYLDPNPNVSGSGVQRLQAAGIACEQLQLSAIDDFYRSYAYWTSTRHPWVTLKLALSSDYKIAGPNGKPCQITGPECQVLTHTERLRADAILTTATTIIRDNPQLNVRLEQQTEAKPLYILDRQLHTPSTARIFDTAAKVTLLYHQAADPERINTLQKQGVRCVQLEAGNTGLALTTALDYIGQQGIHDLWVEAGARCFQSFYEQQLYHRLLIYCSDKALGADAYNAFTKDFPLLAQLEQLSPQHYGRDRVYEIIADIFCTTFP